MSRLRFDRLAADGGVRALRPSARQTNRRTFGLFLVVFCAIVLTAQSAPAQRTITVGPGYGYNYSIIQLAIAAASDGDTVIVHPGTYVENIHFHGKNIILRSTDPTSAAVVAATIIDGNSSGSVEPNQLKGAE